MQRGIGRKDGSSSRRENDEDVCVQCLVWYVCVFMSRWLEVEVFCVRGSVVSECKLSRKKHNKGGKWVGKFRGTKVQDLMKGLSDIIYLVKMDGDDVIEAEAEVGEFRVGE